jgi:hypothetical protein
VPPPAPEGVLGRCISIPPGEFADRYWASEALLTPAAELPRDFADLFSAEAVDDLIARHGLRTPFLRMAKDGSVLATASFTRSGGVGAGIADQVADDKVLAQLAGGATLVLQALHRTWPPLIDFGTALAAELGHPVQINAYITPPQNQGFAAHYDTHDVFVLQVAGSKRWTIHRPVLDDPLPDQTWDRRRSQVSARAAETPLIDTILAPGDALYLPRGYLHSAVAQGEVSIHLTVGVHALTAYDLARELIAGAASDRELRRSLPMGIDVTDVDALAAHVKAAAARLSAAIDSADADQLTAVAARVGRRQAGETRPAPLPPLAQLAVLRAVDGSTELRLRPGARPLWRTAGDRTVVEVLDITVSWPVEVAPALREALSGRVFRPEELPGLEPDEQLVVARRLIREGLVVAAVDGRDRAAGD